MADIEDHWDGTHPEDHWDGTHPEDVLGGFSEQDLAEWHVLLEETVGYQARHHWKLTMSVPCEDRNDARRRAFELAGEYKPQHPASPQGRRVFQIGIDSWLVHVPGMTTDFHFRVSAARLVAVHDADGNSLIE